GRRARGTACPALLGLPQAIGRAVPADADSHGPSARSTQAGREVTAMVTAPVDERRTTGARSLLTALFSPTTPPTATDVALIAARATLAFLFISHGARRFGWLGGQSLDHWGTFFENTAGLSPGKLFAVIGGLIELGEELAGAEPGRVL